MGIKFSNNASSNIIHALTADATSISITPGTGDLFPSIVEGKDYFYATLAGNNGLEIVKVTKRVLDTMTVERAQDGTSALSFNQGDLFELRIVAADFEDTFSHIETTLEDTVSHVETTLEDTVITLNSSVDNKMSSYLPLSGGTLTGTTLNRNDDISYIFIAGGTGTDGSINSGTIIAWGRNNAYRPGAVALIASNGTVGSELMFPPDGRATINGETILTSAGGTLTGALSSNGVIVRGNNATGYVSFESNYGGAEFLLYGSSRTDGYAGRVEIKAVSDTARSVFAFLPSGQLSIGGETVLTTAGGTLKGPIFLPSGGSLTGAAGDLSTIIFSRHGDYAKPCVILWGEDGAEKVLIRAQNKNAINDFWLYPDGTATLGGHSILTSAGGTLTGPLSGTGVIFRGNNASNYVALEANYGGAECILYSGSRTDGYAGCVEIKAISDNARSILAFSPSGKLSIDGKTVITLVASWRLGNSWYRIWSDGWIEQGGVVDVAAGSNNRSVSVTFHAPFTGSPFVGIQAFSAATGSAYDNSQSVTSRGTTSFSFQMPHAQAGSFGWYACGY